MKEIIGYKYKIDWKKCGIMMLSMIPIVFIILCIIYDSKNINDWKECEFENEAFYDDYGIVPLMIMLQMNLIITVIGIIYCVINKCKRISAEINIITFYNGKKALISEVLLLSLNLTLSIVLIVINFGSKFSSEFNQCLIKHNINYIYYIIQTITSIPLIILCCMSLYYILYGVLWSIYNSIKSSINFTRSIVKVEPILGIV